MINYLKEKIQGKSVLILGFGREGRSTLKAMLKAGTAATIAIADQKLLSLNSEAFEDPDFLNYDLSKVEFFCGPDYQDAIDNFDIVMKSPGIVLNKDITEYTASIVSQMELFFEVYKERIIGITGTKGKSTTTTLLYHIMKECGKPVVLAGNIGIPVFDILQEITDSSVFVIELSCHQLEYMTVSPKWGILLNIYEEHLDHYGTMEKYVASKKKIYVNQKTGDLLLATKEVMPRENQYKGTAIEVDIMYVDKEKQVPLLKYQNRSCVMPTKDISLMGAHNYLDVAFAYGICCEFDISDEDFMKGLKSYVPLPHRLQYIGTVDEVSYYDDSISTIDETTIQALNTVPNADTVLIGGMERDISYVNLEEYLDTSSVAHIILMEATGKRIYKEIQENYPNFSHMERLYVVEHLEDAVALAKKITKKGGSCILSPAAASYGIFKNFEERGDVFAKLVHKKAD